MALQLSDGLRNYLGEHGCLKHAFAGGKIYYYTGSQPASANAALTGTLLCTFTLASGAHTAEVQAQGTVTLTGGASGSVNTLTVNGVEVMGSATSFNTSLAQTALDIIDKINNNPASQTVIADSGGSAIIRLTAKPGYGAVANGWVVASTVTTITKTDVNIGTTTAGVTQVNGLLWGDASSGQLIKHPSQVWSGTAAATGTAGYFRVVGAVADAGSLDSSAVYRRLDGNIATSGANLNLSSTSIVSAAVQTINTFSLTFPAS